MEITSYRPECPVGWIDAIVLRVADDKIIGFFSLFYLVLHHGIVVV